MANKDERHRVIMDLISAHVVGSQEELRHLLGQRGLQITQATLSRDLREMAVMRAPTAQGARYVRASQISDEGKPALEALLPQWFDSIDGVSEQIVLHTLSSGAQPIAEAIDAQHWPEVLGTLAGENTILIICRSIDGRLAVTARLERLAGAS